MQSRPQTNGQGVVKWVVPPNGRSRKPGQVSRETGKNNDLLNSNYCDERSLGDDAQSVLIDYSTCRTICTFIQEHLRQLKEHQALINKARTKLVNSDLHQESVNINAIARSDICRLKVRDEQTRANETIKRLTDYLRELTYIEKQCNNSTRSQSNGDIIDRLSDIRAEIIQSLNDFVIANSDIDVPIINSDDDAFDYDLCIDAQTRSRVNQKPEDIIASNSCDEIGRTKIHDTFNNSSSIYQDDSLGNEIAGNNQKFVINSSDRLIDLEKRNREVEKLDRETEELRRLFSDFYGLIKFQGEEIDSIEDNIVIATQRIGVGQQNINKTMKSLTILMPVTGCMAGALIGGPVGLVIGGKLGGITIGCASSLFGLLSSYSIQRCISTSKTKND